MRFRVLFRNSGPIIIGKIITGNLRRLKRQGTTNNRSVIMVSIGLFFSMIPVYSVRTGTRLSRGIVFTLGKTLTTIPTRNNGKRLIIRHLRRDIGDSLIRNFTNRCLCRRQVATETVPLFLRRRLVAHRPARIKVRLNLIVLGPLTAITRVNVRTIRRLNLTRQDVSRKGRLRRHLLGN